MATARSKHKASGVTSTADSYGVSPLHNMRRHRRQQEEQDAARQEVQRVARIRQAMLKQHLEAVAATGRRTETAAGGSELDAEEELRRWRRRHRRQAPVEQLMAALFPPMAHMGGTAAPFPGSSRPGTAAGSMAQLLDAPPAAATPNQDATFGSTADVFEISNLSRSRQAGLASTNASGTGGAVVPTSAHALPPGPPAGSPHGSVSFEDQVEVLQPDDSEHRAFSKRRQPVHTAPQLSQPPARGGKRQPAQTVAPQAARYIKQPQSWARVAYRRPRWFNRGRRFGVLPHPTQQQLDSMFIQGRTIIAHYCVIPDPPSVVITLPQATSRAGSDGDARSVSASPGAASGGGASGGRSVELEVELCEMYPQFDRLNVVANRIMGLNHMAGVFGQGVSASTLRRVRARLCSCLAGLFPFLLGHPGDEEGHVTPTAQRRTGKSQLSGATAPAACVRTVTPHHSTPLLSLFAPPPARTKLYTTPFKADIRLPGGSQMTLFMPELGPLDPPYAKQAVHALRRDAGFGVDQVWGGAVAKGALAQYVLEAAHAQAERGGRAPSMSPQDILDAITGEGGAAIPGAVSGGARGGSAGTTTRPLASLDRIARGMAHTGLGFLGGRCTQEALLRYWRGLESKIQGQLSQSLLKWSMGIPLGQSAGGKASRNGRVTGLELAIPTRPPSAQIKGPLPEYVLTPPGGMARDNTGFQGQAGASHRWDTERTGSEHRDSIRGASATEARAGSMGSSQGGRVASAQRDMSAFRDTPAHSSTRSASRENSSAGHPHGPVSGRSATGEAGAMLASDTMAAAGAIQAAFRAASAGGAAEEQGGSSSSDDDGVHKSLHASPVASEASEGDTALGVGVVQGGGAGLSETELQAAQAVRVGVERIAQQLHMVFLGTPSSRGGLTRAVKEDAAISKQALLLATEEHLQWKPHGQPSQWPEDMRERYATKRSEIVARRDEIYSKLKAEWEANTLMTLASNPHVQDVLRRAQAKFAKQGQ